MKKIILTITLGLLVTISTIAQENKSKSKSPIPVGTWMLGSNLTLGEFHPANTSFALSSINGVTNYNVGFEGGYFIKPNLAVIAGFGYGGTTSENTSGTGEAGESGQGENGIEGGGESGSGGLFSYKIGLKYYLKNVIPLQIDYTGTNMENSHYELGLQAGYAFFLGDKFSIEPAIRYNIALNNQPYIPKLNGLQFKLGVAFRF